MMVAKIFALLLLAIPLTASSQTTDVRKEAFRIEGKSAMGYQVAVMGTEEEVKESLTRYLKTLGRIKQSRDYITVPVAMTGGKTYPSPLYAAIRHSGNTTSAWIGMADEEEGTSALDARLEKLVYDFSVTFRREKIQAQIDESLRALQAVEKQHARLVNEHEDLLNKVSNNKRQKIQLEKSLEENKLDLEALTKKIESNKLAQDSVTLVTQQIKKVVEMHKEQQRQVR